MGTTLYLNYRPKHSLNSADNNYMRRIALRANSNIIVESFALTKLALKLINHPRKFHLSRHHQPVLLF